MRTRIWHSDWKPRWLIRCVSAALRSFMDKQETECRQQTNYRNRHEALAHYAQHSRRGSFSSLSARSIRTCITVWKLRLGNAESSAGCPKISSRTLATHHLRVDPSCTYCSMSHSSKNSERYELLLYLKYSLSLPQIISAISCAILFLNPVILTTYERRSRNSYGYCLLNFEIQQCLINWSMETTKAGLRTVLDPVSD